MARGRSARKRKRREIWRSHAARPRALSASAICGAARDGVSCEKLRTDGRRRFRLQRSGELLTPLDRLDRLIAALPPGDVVRGELLDLRMEFAEHEDMISEARQAIEKMEAIIKKVSSPANRIGTFLGAANRETAQIVVGGADYFCNIDPRVEHATRCGAARGCW